MEVCAKLRYLRIAPRKVRLLADLIRGKTVKEAQTTLSFTVKKGALPLLKLLNQAVASASNNFQLNPTNLYISKIIVDSGPKYKRWRPRARGQAYEIQKKTSHITLILDEKIKTKEKIKKIEKIIPPEERIDVKTTRKIKSKTEKPKFESKIFKPSVEKSIKRIFRRKAF